MHCLLISSFEKYFNIQLSADQETVMKTYGLLYIWFQGSSFPAKNALTRRVFRKLWFSKRLQTFAWTTLANMRIGNIQSYDSVKKPKQTKTQTNEQTTNKQTNQKDLDSARL